MNILGKMDDAPKNSGFWGKADSKNGAGVLDSDFSTAGVVINKTASLPTLYSFFFSEMYWLIVP